MTLRLHHTPGQPNHSGVEGRRVGRIGDSRTSWQKPAVAELCAWGILIAVTVHSPICHRAPVDEFRALAKRQSSFRSSPAVNIVPPRRLALNAGISSP
jgi:hypothetical protein